MKIRNLLFPVVFPVCIFSLAAGPAQMEVATKTRSMELQQTCRWIGKAEIFELTWSNRSSKPSQRALQRAEILGANRVQIIYVLRPAFEGNDMCGSSCIARFWACP